MPKTIRMPIMDKWSKIKTINTSKGKKRFVLRNVVKTGKEAENTRIGWRKRGYNARIKTSQTIKQNPNVPRQKGKIGIYTSSKKVKCPEFRTGKIQHKSQRQVRNIKKLPKGKQKNIFGRTVGRLGTNIRPKTKTGTKTKGTGAKSLNKFLYRKKSLKKLLK